MEIKQIKELMSAMGRTGTKRLVIKKENFELELERQESGISVDPLTESHEEIVARQEAALRKTTHTLARPSSQSIIPHTQSGNAPQEEATGIYVTSPMVGTFYATPSPEDPHFVKVGDKIEKNTVVCIIEAMKVMNEVKAGVSGTVAEILVESGHPVEFGTKLFRVT